MPTKTLLKILRNNRFNRIKIQFVSEGDDMWRTNKTYHDCVKVTPYDSNGNLNYYRSRYYTHYGFKRSDFRSKFYNLCDAYNINYAKKYGKTKMDPLWTTEEAYTIRYKG